MIIYPPISLHCLCIMCGSIYLYDIFIYPIRRISLTPIRIITYQISFDWNSSFFFYFIWYVKKKPSEEDNNTYEYSHGYIGSELYTYTCHMHVKCITMYKRKIYGWIWYKKSIQHNFFMIIIIIIIINSFLILQN